MVEWHKGFAQARAEVTGDVATEIPAPGASDSPHRVRLLIDARTPAPPASRGVLRQIARDLSDRSERGDPGILFAKYGPALGPLAMAIPFTAAGVAMLVFLPRQEPHQVLPWVFGSIFTLAGLVLFSMGLSALRRAAAGQPHSDKEPWRLDNAWDPRGARPDEPGKSFTRILSGVFFLVVIGALNLAWTVRMDFCGWVVLAIVLGGFDIVGLLTGALLSSFDFSFDLPSNVSGTDLTKSEPTYWLLEVRAPLAGPDFSAQFLVPIYAPRSA